MRCSSELRELLMASVDPGKTEVDLDRLAEILRSDPEARAYYYQFMELHAELELKHTAPLAMPVLTVDTKITADIAKSSSKPKSENYSASTINSASSTNSASASLTFPKSMFLPKLALPIAIGACSVLLAIGITKFVPSEPIEDASPILSQNPDVPQNINRVVQLNGAARIVRVAGCQWRGESYAVNDLVSPGSRVDLAAGAAEVQMAGGALVIVEGPASFVVETSGSGYLKQGQIFCNVPSDSDGFTVRTPSAMVVDLGTVFGVLVNTDGTTEAHVAKGMVGIQPNSPSEADESGEVMLVSQQEAARMRPKAESEAELIQYQSDQLPQFLTSEINLTAHQSGGVVRSHAQGMLFGVHSQGTRRVGTSSLEIPTQNQRQTKEKLGLANIILFRLPKLAETSKITAATLELTYKDRVGEPTYSVDLYGLGSLNLQSQRGDWFYEGEQDTKTPADYGLFGSETPVQLVSQAVITPSDPTGRIAISNDSLVTFVQSFYKNGTREGEVAVFRLSANEKLRNVSGATGYAIVHPPVIPRKTTRTEMPVLRLSISEGGGGITEHDRQIEIPIVLGKL